MQLKLSQIGKGQSFIFNNCEFKVLQVTNEGIFVRHRSDNHLFTLPGNTEVQQPKDKIIDNIKKCEMNQGPYKQTGNLAVDIVAGCINHYASYQCKVSRIVLHPKMWDMFTDFVKAQMPDYDYSDGRVDFDGVDILKGTTLMIKDMYWEFGKSKMEIIN